MQPAGQRDRIADGTGAPGQDRERGLERILDVGFGRNEILLPMRKKP